MRASDGRGAPGWVRVAAAIVRRIPVGRYRLLNALPRGAGGFWMRLPAAAGGYEFRCDLRDSVSREACFTGVYEPQETALLRQLLGDGMTFVDVGANWGYHTLLAAHLVGPAGRVVAVEPHPGLFADLDANVRRNGLAQVITRPVAAADRVGTVTLEGYDDTGGNFGVSRLSLEAPADGAERVPSARLDDLLDDAHVEEVDVLKMDVEGAEGLALRGLDRRLAGRRVRHLLLELHPAQMIGDDTADTLLAWLASLGYAVWRIDHSVEATRRAAYGRVAGPALLSRDGARALRDPWPHLLLTADGLEARS